MTVNTTPATILDSYGELHLVRYENGKRSLVRGIINREGKQLPGLDHGANARFSRCGWCACTAKQAKATMASLSSQDWHPVKEWSTRNRGKVVRVIVGRKSSDGFAQGYGSGPSSWADEAAITAALNGP